jgi:hypothetical protein
MIFHIVGTACVAASLVAPINPEQHRPAICAGYEGPKDYATLMECTKDANKATTPIPKIDGKRVEGMEWMSLNCIQIPESK